MKKFYSVFGFLALLLLAGTALLHLALPDKAYSETEKRNLAGAPVLSAERIFDGRAMTDIEAYAADQFPLRAFWMHARMNLMQAEGLRENEGVVLLSDGSLAECFDGWDEEKMNALAGALRRFAGENEFRAVYLLPVTTKSGLYPELFPDWLTPASQRLYAERLKEELRREVTVLDGRTPLSDMKAEGGQVYFLTDHHWTQDAARRTFEENAAVTGWKTGSWSHGVVSNGFLGSLAAKSGFTPRYADSVSAWKADDGTDEVLILHAADGKTTVGFYDYAALERSDRYEFYLGTNEPELVIRTVADTNDTLLVLKDSYANAFIPFLAGSYKTITVVDPRYYAESLDMLLAEDEYTDVLILYNIQTLSQDSHLQQLLSE